MNVLTSSAATATKTLLQLPQEIQYIIYDFAFWNAFILIDKMEMSDELE